MFTGPASGLYFSPSPFNGAPAGSLIDATNVRFTNPGVLGPRPGMSLWANSTFGSTGDERAGSLGIYKRMDGTVSYLVSYDGVTVAEKIGGANFVDFATTYYVVGTRGDGPLASRMRFEEAAKTVFWNTTQGLVAYDGTDALPAGCPPPLSISLAGLVEANGWMLGDTAVAYQATVCRKDAYGRLIESAPSGRLVVRNAIVGAVGSVFRLGGVTTVNTGEIPHYLTTGDTISLPTSGDANFPAGGPFTVTVTGQFTFTYPDAGAITTNTSALTYAATRSVQLEVFLPTGANGVTTENFVRLYRTEMTATAADTPSADLFLVFQTGFLGPLSVVDGFVDIHDITPEGFIQGDQSTAGYWSANFGDGATAARLQPPVSHDISYWANRMWFANTYERDSLEVDLIGTGSPNGLQAGDTFTIESTLFAGRSPTSGPLGPNEFYVYTAGDPGTNIEKTTASLISAINSSGIAAYAYYISGETGTPGKILFVATQFGQPLSVFSSRSDAWAPVLSPDSSTYSTTSTNNAHPARLVYSPLGIPDAVTSVNYTEVNADNDMILRIWPLHYRMLVFKTDGIYYITNIEPFTILKLSDYKLIAPDSVHQVEDTVYALTDCGQVAITDGGIERVSIPIDTALNALEIPTLLPTFSVQTLGLGYRTARQSLLWTIDSTGLLNTQAWAYSTLSDGYTRYDFGVNAAVIDPVANQLIVAPTDDNELWLENKTGTNSDFVDLSFQLKAASTGLLTSAVVPVSSTNGITVGDALGFDPGTGIQYWTIVAIDTINHTVTLLGVPAWTVTSGVSVFTIAEAFATSVVFNKLSAASPGVMKMWQAVTYLWRTNTFYNWNASFYTEASPSTENVLQTNDAWGLFSWGVLPWGNPCEQTVRVEPFPTQHGNATQMTLGFNMRQAFANFEFLGVDVISKSDTIANRSK